MPILIDSKGSSKEDDTKPLFQADVTQSKSKIDEHFRDTSIQHTMVALEQLRQVSAYATNMFQELQNDLTTLSKRIKTIGNRVNHINSVLDSNEIADAAGSRFESSNVVSVQMNETNREVLRELLIECESLPDLSILDKYSTTGPSVKKISDPDVFRQFIRANEEEQLRKSLQRRSIRRSMKMRSQALVEHSLVAEESREMLQAGALSPTANDDSDQDDDPELLAKYQNMICLGEPEGAVALAAKRDNVVLSPKFFRKHSSSSSNIVTSRASEASETESSPQPLTVPGGLEKYEKMLKAGLPEGAILQAAQRDHVHLPDNFFATSSNALAAPVAPPPLPKFSAPTVSTSAELPSNSNGSFEKYRRMQKAGLPEGAINQAAARDGVTLPSSFFQDSYSVQSSPSSRSPATTPQGGSAQFDKYRKMLRAGLPEGAIMQSATRDGVKLPSNFFGDAGSPAVTPSSRASSLSIEAGTPLEKYQRMRKAGLPQGAISQAAARDGVTLPAKFFDDGAAEPDANNNVRTFASSDDRLTKYEKMLKTKVPEGAIRQAAIRDGIVLPDNFFT